MGSANPRATRSTLSREDCLGRLAQSDLARVVTSVRCLPAALPARISVVADDRLLLASAEGPVVSSARRHDVISVQVDGLEPGGATWSVMASGIARLAPEGTPVDDRLGAALALGADLIEVPLSVVVGERVG
jgi:nitroimidazol reductase NimA-like FMN-containing flavoprotein (pyridoxamine 5'-phosphate oxidase superfamily)